MSEKNKIHKLYRWLPIQLLFLHFRSKQLLLMFWLLLVASIFELFATSFGAQNLFLAPIYLGQINTVAYLYMGMALGVFIMSWQITSFIVQSIRFPFLAFSRQVFLKYCINNGIIPAVFTAIYIWKASRFLRIEEGVSVLRISVFMFLFVIGILLVFLISFLYFFNLGKDVFRSSFERISNPSRIQKFIPYDRLDGEHEFLTVDSMISQKGWMTPISKVRPGSYRLFRVVLKKHQRNAAFAVLVAFVLLIIIGNFIEYPIFQIPAGAGVLLFFSVLIAFLGMLKYFLKTWELLGWIVISAGLALLIQWKALDFRSYVDQLNYYDSELPEYNYVSIKTVLSDSLYQADLQKEEDRIRTWSKARGGEKKPVVLVALSGGGARSMYWSFRALQYADSLSGGELFKQTILITGASGGMIGGSYWRNLHTVLEVDKSEKYIPDFQDKMGSDLLNPVILGLVTIDLISPFNKINNPWRQRKDRGYVFEQALIKATDSVLYGPLDRFLQKENDGHAPLLVPYATILNDGRKLIFSSKSMTFLNKSAQELGKDRPIIDAIDFTTFFEHQDAKYMALNSALRMSASFPIVLPITHLPSQPKMKILDGGLRDNFGDEVVMRYVATMNEVLEEVASEVIILQIRDTRDYLPEKKTSKMGLIASVLSPAISIQQNWKAFQTYKQTYANHLSHDAYDEKLKLKTWTLTYSPKEDEKSVPLNFYLTQKQKEKILLSIWDAGNQEVFQSLTETLKGVKHKTPE